MLFTVKKQAPFFHCRKPHGCGIFVMVFRAIVSIRLKENFIVMVTVIGAKIDSESLYMTPHSHPQVYHEQD